MRSCLTHRTDRFGGRILVRSGSAGSWGVLALVVWLGCLLASGSSSTVWAVPPIVRNLDPAYDPDWPEVFTILTNKCISCHRSANERSDLTDYEHLMAARMPGSEPGPLVVPGDPERSPLFESVRWNVRESAQSEEPDEPLMPADRAEWLSAGQLATLHRWISNGAKLFRAMPGRGLTACEIDFPSARQCAACHPQQYEQWSRSMHAYAQHSPIFEAFNLTLEERTDGTLGTFCTRCHTPIGTQLGESGLVRNVDRSRLSMEGVTCIACHRRKDRRYRASGRVTVEPGGVMDGCVYGPFDDSPSADVGTHPSVGSAYIRSSQFCGECHDVTSPNGVRLEEAFSEYLNSPAAERGIRCQDCHMHDNPGVPLREDGRPLGRAAVVPGLDPEKLPLRRLSDHTFAGPDYSVLPDTEFPKKLDWMYETDYRNEAALTLWQQETLRQLRIDNRKSLGLATEQRVRLLRNSARLKVEHVATAQPGAIVPVRVNVTSLTAGHGLPTGFTAEREVWVSITVTDPRGTIIFASGDGDDNDDLRHEQTDSVLRGDVPHDPYLLSFQNKFTALSYRGTERSVVLSVNRDLAPISLIRPAPMLALSFGRPSNFRISKGSLAPLATMGQTYPVPLGGAPGPHTVVTRLNFRHLPPTLLDYVGTPHLKHLLQTVVIDESVTMIETAGTRPTMMPQAMPQPMSPSVGLGPAPIVPLARPAHGGSGVERMATPHASRGPHR